MTEEPENSAFGDERFLPDGEDSRITQRDRRFPRRTFLAGAGAVTGAAAADYLAHAALFRGPKAFVRIPLLPITSSKAPTFTIMLRRREDMLSLQVDGYNLVRHGQNLVRGHGSQTPTLVFTFPPQHLAEEAFFSGTPAARPGGSRALLSQPSRIAFTVPKHVSIPLTIDGLLNWSNLELSLTPAAAYSPPPFFFELIARDRRRSRADRRHAARRAKLQRDFALQNHALVSPVALPRPIILEGPGKPPEIRAAEPTETSIELPWHLAISPIAGSHWSHSADPVTLDGNTELWRTRLAGSSSPNAGDGGSLRAIWNFDTETRDNASPGRPTLDSANPPSGASALGTSPSGQGLGPFRSSLKPHDRWQIVHLTSDFTLTGRADVHADKLWLSARGGYLDSNGVWDQPTGPYDLVQWKHLATAGRDQFVKVVDKGFLFPFGHRVVQVTITERQFENVDGETVAVERQILYLQVRQPTTDYTAATFGTANDGRDFPFRQLTLKTLRTPNLDSPVNFVDSRFGFHVAGFQGTPFVPTVGGNPFMWHFVGTDWVGREIPFTAQAVFVDSLDATASTAALVRVLYNGLDSSDPLRVANFFGKTVAFAASLTTGDTDLQVKSMSFGASPGSGGSVLDYEINDTAECVPTLAPSVNGVDTGAQAIVRHASAEQASGGAPLNGNPNPAVAYYPPYVTTGFSTSQQLTGNAGNVYLEILYDQSNATNIVFGGGSSGGVLTPNLQLAGISRSLGPVADLDNIFAGTFNPSSVFAGLSDDLQARILGGIPLSELIAPVANFLDGASPEVPNDKALKITYGIDPTTNVETTTVKWSPDIVTDHSIVRPRATGPAPTFTLLCTITTDPSNPSGSTYSITGTLKNFDVFLMSADPQPSDQFIQITFDSLVFSSQSGQKANVDVKINAVQFVGPLKFVEQLANVLGDFSGDGGPKIQILPTGVDVDLSIALPTLAVGLFSLSNVAFDANFMLPFDGSPAIFGFGFSSRDNPFQLSIAIFGGGGYFTIKLFTGGVKEIDAGFDFGAMAAINIGVASGSISLTAGFQFSYSLDINSGKHTCILTGYVKLTGNMSILGGIVSMSLEFDLSLTYEETSSGSSVTGSATISISISVLFFHFSVSATATKTFTNSGSGGSVSARVHAGHGRLPGLAPGSTPTFADQMTLQDWQAYCQAYA